MTYAVDPLRIDDIDLDQANTDVVMNQDSITASMKDFTLKCFTKAKFATDPIFFFGTGIGKVDTKRVNSTVEFNFYKGKNNLPALKLINSNCDLTKENVQAEFSGDNDIFTLLNMTQDFTISMLVEYLNGTMSKETKEAIEGTINDLLGKIPPIIQIPGTDIAFNLGLLIDPKVEKGHVPMAIDGTSDCINKTACREYSGPWPQVPPETPVFEGSGSLQFLLSDYLFNSLSVAAYRNSLFNFTVTPEQVHEITGGAIELDTDFFSVFIPAMRKVYGKARPIMLKVSMTSAPMVKISPKEMDFTLTVLFAVYVKDTNNTYQHAFDTELTSEFKLTVKMANNVVKGNIGDYKFSLELKYKAFEDVTVDELNNFFNAIFKLSIPQINNILNEGFKIPPIGGFDLGKSELTLLPQYVKLDFNPEPIKKMVLPFSLDELARKLIEAYNKVKAVQAVEQMRPTNLPEWLKVEL